jgi:hypothetical protein
VDTVLDVPVRRDVYEVRPGVAVTLEATPLPAGDALRGDAAPAPRARGRPDGRPDGRARVVPVDGGLALVWRDGARGLTVRLRGAAVDEAELRALQRRVRARASAGGATSP